jgi:putative transport protein
VILSLIMAAASVACAVVAARFLDLDAGGSAGLLAGAMSSSAAVGTAGDAIGRLPVEEAARQALRANLSVVYAVAYLCGFVAELVILTRLAPWLMRVDLAAECRKLEETMGVPRKATGVFSAHRDGVVRAYRLPAGFAAGTAAELERRFAPARVFVERLRRGDIIHDVGADTRLEAGDILALTGRYDVLVGPENPLQSHEIDDRELLDLPVVLVNVVVTRKWPSGRTLGQIVEESRGTGAFRSVFLQRIVRAGEPIPVGAGTVPERGDLITFAGPPSAVARAADLFGKAEWPSVTTDLVWVALAIALGGLLGLPTFPLFGIPIGLTVPVGVLLAGLVVGWLRSVRPLFARIPEPVVWVFETLGLCGFIGIIGINAGPGFGRGALTAGPAILLAATLIRLIPNLLTLWAGRAWFRLHPGILLGVCAGAGSSTAALGAVKDRAESDVPMLGYGLPYAMANVLLGLAATILVTMMAR